MAARRKRKEKAKAETETEDEDEGNLKRISSEGAKAILATFLLIFARSRKAQSSMRDMAALANEHSGASYD